MEIIHINFSGSPEEQRNAWRKWNSVQLNKHSDDAPFAFFPLLGLWNSGSLLGEAKSAVKEAHIAFKNFARNMQRILLEHRRGLPKTKAWVKESEING